MVEAGTATRQPAGGVPVEPVLHRACASNSQARRFPVQRRRRSCPGESTRPFVGHAREPRRATRGGDGRSGVGEGDHRGPPQYAKHRSPPEFPPLTPTPTRDSAGSDEPPREAAARSGRGGALRPVDGWRSVPVPEKVGEAEVGRARVEVGCVCYRGRGRRSAAAPPRSLVRVCLHVKILLEETGMC